MSNRLILDKVQDYRKVPNTNQVRLVATHTYVRVSEAGNPPLYAQDGKVFPENGPAFKYDEIPSWFWAHWRRVDPAKRGQIGVPLPEERNIARSSERDRPQEPVSAEEPDTFDLSTLDTMTRKELLALKKEKGVKGVTKGKTDDELREMLRRTLG